MPNIRRRRLITLLLVGVVTTVALYPWKTTVVPEWRVRIVDHSGSPLGHAAVREVWHHSSLESGSHQQDLVTDKDGYVTFPERTIRAPLALRVLGSMVTKLNPHGSSDPFAIVIVLSPAYDTWSNNALLKGQPLPKEIVVTKNR